MKLDMVKLLILIKPRIRTWYIEDVWVLTRYFVQVNAVDKVENVYLDSDQDSIFESSYILLICWTAHVFKVLGIWKQKKSTIIIVFIIAIYYFKVF